jgi:predicted dienelactone hydrolase
MRDGWQDHRVRRAARWMGTAALSMAAACTGGAGAGKDSANSDADVDPAEETPAERWARAQGAGPYGVGWAEGSLSYTPWAGPPLPEGSPGEGDRSLRLAVWWPTEADPGAFPEPRYFGTIPADGVALGAPLAAGASRPMLLISHGHQGYAEATAFIAERFASHGWIVLAPDHTDNTFVDSADRSTDIYWKRPLDLAAVLDLALSGDPIVTDAAGDALTAADLSGEVVLAGHSFGGFTAHAMGGAAFDAELIAACLAGEDTTAYCSTMDPLQGERLVAGFKDPRVLGLISMAPGDRRLFGEAGFGSLDLPVLHMTGGLDPNADDDSTWEALKPGVGPRLRAELPNANHTSFTDLSGLIEPEPTLMAAELSFQLIGGLALCWAELLLGEPAEAVFTDEIINTDEVVLMRP